MVKSIHPDLSPRQAHLARAFVVTQGAADCGGEVQGGVIVGHEGRDTIFKTPSDFSHSAGDIGPPRDEVLCDFRWESRL